MKFTLFAAVFPTIMKTANALQCGTALTTDCIAATDIRYDSEYTNDLLKQASVWDKKSGLAKFTTTSRGSNGELIYAVPYDEITGTYGAGPLTNLVEVEAYTNETIVGSRSYRHIYLFTRPVPAELCQGGPPEGVFDVDAVPPEGTDADADTPICGVHGRLITGDTWGTSTYEKDGTVRDFKGLGKHKKQTVVASSLY